MARDKRKVGRIVRKISSLLRHVRLSSNVDVAVKKQI
jgi:hypothetical protein